MQRPEMLDDANRTTGILLEQAAQYIADGKVESALACYDRATRNASSDALVFEQAATALGNAWYLEDAAEMFKRVANLLAETDYHLYRASILLNLSINQQRHADTFITELDIHQVKVPEIASRRSHPHLLSEFHDFRKPMLRQALITYCLSALGYAQACLYLMTDSYNSEDHGEATVWLVNAAMVKSNACFKLHVAYYFDGQIDKCISLIQQAIECRKSALEIDANVESSPLAEDRSLEFMINRLRDLKPA